MRPFGVVLLAAGSSSRLGVPKQLVSYRGKTLIEHLAGEALVSGATEVVVVLGAHADRVAEVIEKLPVQIVRNPDWESGMASSIRAGILSLSESIDGVVIMLADQPSVSAAHVAELGRTQLTTGAPIVASEYEGVLGVPAAFGRSLFPRLVELRGDEGARALIRNGGAASIPLEGGGFDVDFAADLAFVQGS